MGKKKRVMGGRGSRVKKHFGSRLIFSLAFCKVKGRVCIFIRHSAGVCIRPQSLPIQSLRWRFQS